MSFRNLQRVQECARLGNLVGIAGHTDLRYRDGFAVDHSGEERYLVVLAGPRAA